jgi:hypothetical protein
MDLMHPPRRVTFTIDRLVLKGFAPGQHDSIAAAVAAELQRQFGNAAVASKFQQGKSLALLRGAPLVLRPGATPAEIGTLGARHLVRSMRS